MCLIVNRVNSVSAEVSVISVALVGRPSANEIATALALALLGRATEK